MLKPLSRSEMFRRSPFIDVFTASIQRGYSSDADLSIPAEARYVQEKFDHRTAFNTNEPDSKGHGVMAHPVHSRQEYVDVMPQKLISFFSVLDCDEFYLADFLRNDINSFPFSSFRMKNRFKLLAGNNGAEACYHLDAKGLKQVLPLFFFSRRWDIPVIFLYNANGKVDIAVNLCDDGNWHLNYHERDHNNVVKAAEKAGFMFGGLELCSVYYVAGLR